MSDNASIRQRLWAIREYLGVHADIDDSSFEPEVVAASKSIIGNIPDASACRTGESFTTRVASHLGVTFEEIRSKEDIVKVTAKYLEKNELGFGQLSLELEDPTVDALLFKRMNAEETDSDRFVAVLNLQTTDSRAYWSRVHEVSHRVAEPPQHELPLYRHRANQKNDVEHIIDLVAAEIGFFEPIFEPIVRSHVVSNLTWNIVEDIRAEYAPTSSLMSVTRAVLRYWPLPVVMLESTFRGRKQRPNQDQALRTSIIGWSPTFRSRHVYFFTNMRVPASSPISQSYNTRTQIEEFEFLNEWCTSGGSRLPAIHVFTSARAYGENNLALITLA